MVTVRTREQQYGNQVSSMIVPIPTDEPDPRRRLERAHEVMSAAKERHRAIPAKLLSEANHTVPPALFTRTARVMSMTTGAGWIGPPFNVTISNIRGRRPRCTVRAPGGCPSTPSTNCSTALV